MNDIDIAEHPQPAQEEMAGPTDELASLSEQSDSPDSYCQVCKQNPKDFTENPDSLLCTSCREQLIHYPFPKWLFAVMAAVLILGALAFVRVPSLVGDYKSYRAAESAYGRMAYNTAANTYLSLSSRYQNSRRINERLFLALCKAQRFDEAGLLFDERMAGKEANDETYEEIQDYADLLSRYYTTLGKITEIVNAGDTEKTAEQVAALKQDVECDQAMVVFYLAQLNTDPEQTLVEYQQAYELQPKYTIFQSQIGHIQRRLRRYDEAIRTYDAVLKERPEDADALKGLGIIKLLQGEIEKGVEYTQKAYELNPAGAYVTETYASALYASGKQTEAKALYESLKENEAYVADQEYDDFFAGKATLEQLYLG